MGSPASVPVTASPPLVFPERVFGAYLLRLVPLLHRICVLLDLIALPPSLTSPSPG